MRFLPIFFLTTALAQQPQPSHTTESLRGVSAVTRKIAWASGTHGTYLRTTDAGAHWQPAQVPGAESLDFRAVVAFSAAEAFLMSSGPGDQSRIYHTTDAGHHWQLQFKNENPKGFYDSMIFFDRTHGLALGDPVPDENGKLKFEVITTEDGKTWHPIPASQIPPAVEGEGAFAASNTCLAIVPSNSVILSETDTRSQSEDPRSRRIPIVLTSLTAQQGVLSSQSSDDEISSKSISWKSGALAPRPSFWVAQRFSAAIKFPELEGASAPAQAERDPFKKPAHSTPHLQKQTTPDHNIWFATGGSVARVFHSSDRGQTWQVADTPIVHGADSAGIFSIAFRDPLHGVIAGGDYKHPDQDGSNLAFTQDGGRTWTLSPIKPQAFFSAATYDRENPDHLYLVAQDFIYEVRNQTTAHRIDLPKASNMKLNATSPYPTGGAMVVGAKGAILSIP